MHSNLNEQKNIPFGIFVSLAVKQNQVRNTQKQADIMHSSYCSCIDRIGASYIDACFTARSINVLQA